MQKLELSRSLACVIVLHAIAIKRSVLSLCVLGVKRNCHIVGINLSASQAAVSSYESRDPPHSAWHCQIHSRKGFVAVSIHREAMRQLVHPSMAAKKLATALCRLNSLSTPLCPFSHAELLKLHARTLNDYLAHTCTRAITCAYVLALLCDFWCAPPYEN